MADKVKEKCRRCANNWKCDIRGVIEFHQPIDPDHPKFDYMCKNIYRAYMGDCPFFKVID